MDISSLTPEKQVNFKYWLNVIHECRASGLTNHEWCEQNNISLKSYYYWIAKFRKLALEELPRKEYSSSLRGLVKQTLPANQSSTFIEIPTVPSDSESFTTSAPAGVLKMGRITIELYNNTSESFLHMLMKELQTC